MTDMGETTYKCAADKCDRDKRQKLGKEGKCETCPPGWLVSACGKFCYDPVTMEDDIASSPAGVYASMSNDGLTCP
jgi:hypothetical protein